MRESSALSCWSERCPSRFSGFLPLQPGSSPAALGIGSSEWRKFLGAGSVRAPAMRVCLLVHDLSPSGGVRVIISHARALQQAGHEVELLLTHGAPARHDGLVVSSLKDARVNGYDCAIATWWETAPALYELQAKRRLAFLQSFEQRFYTQAEPLERQGAAAVLALPVD